jgi:hypothetical protein
MRTLMLIAAIGALLSGWLLRDYPAGPERAADPGFPAKIVAEAPPESTEVAGGEAHPRPAAPLETARFEPPREPEALSAEVPTYDEIFAAGGRLSWAPRGSWARGAPAGTWHLGPKDLPAGEPTGVRFNRGLLAAQLASVQGRTRWFYVEFNGHDTAPPPAMAEWIGSLELLEAAVLRDMDLGGDVLTALRACPSLVHLSFEDSDIAARALEHLVGLPLQSLELREADIADADLEAVGQMTGLEYLSLSRTPISDRGLGRLEKLANLRELVLRDLGVTGSGLTRLDLAALEVLDLEDSGADDRFLASLRDCPRLRRLNLNETRIRGSGLRHLSALASLESLELEDTPLEGPFDGFGGLARLPRLRNLLLDGSTIDDGAIPYLLGLKQLTDLHAEDTGLSDFGLAQLTVSLAPCKIHR